MRPLRGFFLDLAAEGLRMPIGADLVLAEKTDVEAIKLDGSRLGGVIAESARRWCAPLAVVKEETQELLSRIRAIGRPFILGSECDVLSIPGRTATIKAKVEAFLN
jgi:hypothetical protein